MKSARPRIHTLALLFAGGGAVVLVQLYLLMVVQNDFWLERSYRNRWAFQDVPTRRGAILDRRGAVLAEDTPAFSLVVHYRRFRREHPAGLALHGANLLARVAGAAVRFGLEGGPDEVVRAGGWLLRAPCAWLRGEGIDEEAAGNLGFYVRRLLARLEAGVPRSIVEGRQAAPDALVVDVVPDAPAVLARLRARARELDEVDAGLRAAGARGLWEALESYRRSCEEHAVRERYLWNVDRRVGFELAARLQLLAERHPGLGLQPSVERRRGRVPGRRDLGSLDAVVGLVTPFWKEDGRPSGDAGGRPPLLQRAVDAALPGDASAGLVPRDPDLPPPFREHLQEAAEREVWLFYVNRGRVGRTGLERVADARLAGRPGLRLVEHDRTAEHKALWTALDTTPGRDVRVTLDLELQARLEAAMDAHAAGRATAAAVVEVESGAVLALGSRPLRSDDGERVWACYANVWPTTGSIGSLAKPFVMLEQLDAARRGREHRSASTFAPCDGRYEARGLARALTCSGHHGLAARDGPEALAQSCNFYFFQAAEGIGADGLRRAFARAGWVPHAGPPGAWQREVDGLLQAALPRTDPGGRGLRRHAIGYGVEASALYVARAYAGLATGLLRPLHLLAGEEAAGVPLGCHPDDLALVRAGLRGCVERGTARGVGGLRGLGVAAKTGTAEISVTSGANNAWFAGFVPERAPRIAFAAVAYGVEHDTHGGEIAGELVADFLQRVAADPELRETWLRTGGEER